MDGPIYLDSNATTPLAPEVFEAMRPFLENHHGNPSSLHSHGRMARAAIDDARDSLAATLKVRPAEIIFTSGGTESDNLGILGLARHHQSRGRHLVTTSIEHHAVLHAFEWLEKREGFLVTYLPVDGAGRVSVETFAAALRPDTVLASVMCANNETGVLQPVPELAAVARSRGVLFHTDAVQGMGKIPVKPHEWGVDALSLSAHKFYGPKGAGALFLKFGLALDPILYGGYHEGERRPGTENVAAITGLAAAARRIEPLLADQERQRELTELLWAGLSGLEGIRRNGDPVGRTGNTLNVSFDGLDGEELIMSLDLEGVSVSSGSACMVGSVQASHVLLAMGVPERAARATIRFSTSLATTREEIERAAEVTRNIVSRLRKHSPTGMKAC